MRKAAFAIIILSLVLSAAGCVFAPDGNKASNPGSGTAGASLDSPAVISESTGSAGTVPEAVPETVPETVPEAAPDTGASSSTVSPAAALPDDNTASSSDTGGSVTGSSFGVVAKSSNAVSGKDKEEVLNELDKQLDSLFTDINRMEEVKDSDLKMNGQGVN